MDAPTSSHVPEPAGVGSVARSVLLALARASVEAAARNERMRLPEPVGWPERLRQPGACFVTLHKGGRLRGCIGTLSARDPLHRAVVDCAQGAATRDSRFPEVRPEELKDLRIEVSVLTEARRLEYQTPAELVGRLVPHRDGVILQLDSRKATYLPQVWEQLPDPVTFLDSLAEKAGGAAGAWRAPGTVVFTYQVEAFEEPEAPARGTEG